MPLMQLTDRLVVNTDEILTAYRTDSGRLRIVLRSTWREIEIETPQVAERAWNVLTSI